MDVFAILNETIALIIEDKTYTEEHSDQLQAYRDQVRVEFPGTEIAAIYVKTGDQSSYKGVEDADYAVFRRKDFLRVLEQGRQLGVTNAIFCDFHEHLTAMEEAVQSYKRKSVAHWTGESWTGFFMKLQERLGDGGWGYVPNQSGGFMGYWWHGKHKYLQLEEEKLCFKIVVDEASERSVQRNKWHDDLMAESKRSDISVSKPPRFGNGEYMTAAILDDDYRQVDAAGILELEATIAVLRKAEKFLDSAMGKP